MPSKVTLAMGLPPLARLTLPARNYRRGAVGMKTVTGVPTGKPDRGAGPVVLTTMVTGRLARLWRQC